MLRSGVTGNDFDNYINDPKISPVRVQAITTQAMTPMPLHDPIQHPSVIRRFDPPNPKRKLFLSPQVGRWKSPMDRLVEPLGATTRVAPAKMRYKEPKEKLEAKINKIHLAKVEVSEP